MDQTGPTAYNDGQIHAALAVGTATEIEMNPNGTGKAFTVYTESTRAFQAIAAEIGD